MQIDREPDYSVGLNIKDLASISAKIVNHDQERGQCTDE